MFLASPLASYVSGVVLPVDGGWSLGGATAFMMEATAAFMPGTKA
jgi:NAD(P)-dependent dehydrogenase (short-subunit alcohol dehydrogenase family)